MISESRLSASASHRRPADLGISRDTMTSVFHRSAAAPTGPSSSSRPRPLRPLPLPWLPLPRPPGRSPLAATATAADTPTAKGTHCQPGWNSPEIIIVPDPMKPTTRPRFFLRS